MDRRMIHLCFLVLFAPSWMAISESIIVLVESPDPVQCGHTATLPCWLGSSQNAEDLEVRWYRADHHVDTHVMHYKEKSFDHGSQEASYIGRVSFDSKDASSGGLKTGDVSLKLLNVTVEDEGDYICYVSSLTSHDSGTMSLHVKETGSTPLLSIMWKEDNLVNVSCESEGWYPQPVLRWSDKTKDLTHKHLMYRKASSGFHSVHSWLIVPGSSEVSCAVGLSPDKEVQEARLRIADPEPTAQRSSPGGWVAFGILLMIALAALGVVYYKIKGKKSKSGCDETDGNKPTDCNGENERLLQEELSTAQRCYVNVKPENSNNPHLIFRDTKVRDSGQNCPDGGRVTCLTAFRGTPGFSCGQHYWEVSLGPPNIDPKASWWIGVTNATEIPQNLEFSPDASNGFWFLSSDPNIKDAFQFSTKPQVFLPARSRPKKVGVYLDYDKHVLSFYNLDDDSLIGSLAATFSGEVFPFFNTGKGDRSPMEILQKTMQDHTVEMEKCGDSFA